MQCLNIRGARISDNPADLARFISGEDDLLVLTFNVQATAAKALQSIKDSDFHTNLTAYRRRNHWGHEATQLATPAHHDRTPASTQLTNLTAQNGTQMQQDVSKAVAALFKGRPGSQLLGRLMGSAANLISQTLPAQEANVLGHCFYSFDHGIGIDLLPQDRQQIDSAQRFRLRYPERYAAVRQHHSVSLYLSPPGAMLLQSNPATSNWQQPKLDEAPVSEAAYFDFIRAEQEKLSERFGGYKIGPCMVFDRRTDPLDEPVIFAAAPTSPRLMVAGRYIVTCAL